MRIVIEATPKAVNVTVEGRPRSEAEVAMALLGLTKAKKELMRAGKELETSQ